MNQSSDVSGATLVLPAPRANAPSRARAAPSLLEQALEMLSRWQERSRSRDELARLGEHQLKDIGLTKSQAMFESGKFFLQP
ncbi:MAG: DUF1127 domain-containing protein [Burkholderiales bacterium]|jgi:uncharacterized protein YjiS (DUF1127 family)|nr:DUF1127 domain-containing protein [Burkholderiales bacterium]